MIGKNHRNKNKIKSSSSTKVKMKKGKKIALIIFSAVVVILIALGIIGKLSEDKLVSESYVGTYDLNYVNGYYLGKGTNDNDKMEYIFQVEPLDGSDTLSDNIDVTEDDAKIKQSYTADEKKAILVKANKTIPKKTMDIFKSKLGKSGTVSVFAASYKDSKGKIKTKYKYELMVEDSDIKDFDKD